MKKYRESELRLINLFRPGQKFYFPPIKSEVVILKSGKPRCKKGEPKTDLYVLVSDGNKQHELKISYKNINADFIENKISAERAESIFGDKWKPIIIEAIRGLISNFESRQCIYKNQIRNTRKGSITLGYKLELTNKSNGELSALLHLTEEQLCNIYAGTNLSEDKRHAMVNGKITQDSGVANFILISDTMNSAQEVINEIIPIETYVKTNPNIYIAFKALNYRTFEQKYDGNRPLAVPVIWSVEKGKLIGHPKYELPFEINGKESANRLLASMNELGIKTTDDIKDDG